MAAVCPITYWSSWATISRGVGILWNSGGVARINHFDGLLVMDSVGGMALAERVKQTEGWREFTLYRIAPQSGPVTATFALAAAGEVWIDDVTIRPISLQDRGLASQSRGNPADVPLRPR